jgi:hypothetical protein
MSGLGMRGRRRTRGCGSPEAGDPIGVEPARMHRHVPVNPARGEAQGRIGARSRWSRIGPQTGVEAQKSKPENPTIDRLFWITRATNRRSIIPTKINRDADASGRNDRWARSDRNVANQRLAAALVRRDHPDVGLNLRRDEPQERRRTSNARRGKTSRPARPR